jgi:hypothetical protein
MGVPLPGMTHLQHAQPLLVSHFLLAHAEAFFRDLDRLAAAAAMADACPMGSGALGGTPFALDRLALAKKLGFARATANSLDAVGDRDFALDYLYALATLAVHLSHLAEDFVLFASQEFGFIVLPDEYSTGSSLMPQKKNPDAWELLRGKTGRITGALVSLLVTLKGLPSSYQRDLQEDKEPVFAAHDQAGRSLAPGCRRSGIAGHRGRALPGSPWRALSPGARNHGAHRARSRARRNFVDDDALGHAKNFFTFVRGRSARGPHCGSGFGKPRCYRRHRSRARS